MILSFQNQIAGERRGLLAGLSSPETIVGKILDHSVFDPSDFLVGQQRRRPWSSREFRIEWIAAQSDVLREKFFTEQSFASLSTFLAEECLALFRAASSESEAKVTN